jgi:hypothetical protein
VRERAGLGDEPVAASVCGLDESRAPRVVGQRFPDLLNGDLQHGVAYESILPDRAEQVLFRDELSGPKDKAFEHTERLRPELDEIGVLPQALVYQVERVGAEMNYQNFTATL